MNPLKDRSLSKNKQLKRTPFSLSAWKFNKTRQKLVEKDVRTSDLVFF
uniref:Syntaxin-132-like n=1 Tax=Rhizophora mucronata TaxID=61149 RepID=A0A2P2PYI3_RHIMU